MLHVNMMLLYKNDTVLFETSNVFKTNGTLMNIDEMNTNTWLSECETLHK